MSQGLIFDSDIWLTRWAVARQDQTDTLSDILMIVLMTHLKFETQPNHMRNSEELILSPEAICKDL